MLILTLPIIITIAAAVIPAIYLLRYIFQKDRLEKEPTGLVVKLVILGIISTVLAVFTETVGSSIMRNFNSNSLAYQIIFNYIVVALSEEGFKYLVLKRATWKNPNFNCQFDAVVYAVSVSLGFALWENIQYTFSYGLTTALVRAFTAVPGHACFGVLMGAWYGMAKKYEGMGDFEKSKNLRAKAVIMPVLAHGTYDLCAGLGSFIGSAIFIVVILVLFYVCRNLVKALSESDDYINNQEDFYYK